ELVNNYNDVRILSIAFSKLSALYIKKGDAQKALDSIDNINKLKGGFLQDFAYYQGAAILETIGKTEEARVRYKELAERFPNSPFAPMAKKRSESQK
ncbi:MAG: tetratricopeptide repeat protein, partial [Thermodesulfovibrionales bacterium]